jgi:hypothetical protein
LVLLDLLEKMVNLVTMERFEKFLRILIYFCNISNRSLELLVHLDPLDLEVCLVCPEFLDSRVIVV